jgi:hypothetical protein
VPTQIWAKYSPAWTKPLSAPELCHRGREGQREAERCREMQREGGREGESDLSQTPSVLVSLECHYLHQCCALQRAEAAAAGAGRRGGGKGDVAVPCPACGLETWLRGGAAGHQVRRMLVRTRRTNMRKYADVQNTQQERWEASIDNCDASVIICLNTRSILQRACIISDHPGILRPGYPTA